MDELILRATTFITTHGAWAGPVIGVLAFGESLAIVGLFIPATAMMLAVGGLMGSGVLDPLPIILWAIAGSIGGDWVSYWAGQRIGPSVYRRWPLNRHRAMVARTRLFFRKYGFFAVFLGRFLGPIRATVPLVAGVLEMPKQRFQIANIASAAIWVPLMFTPGYLAAKSIGPAIALSESHLIIAAMAVSTLALAAFLIAPRFLKKARRQRRRQAQAPSPSRQSR